MRKKTRSLCLFFYESDLNTSPHTHTHTQKELTCGLLRGEPRKTVRLFFSSIHERVSNHVSLKERGLKLFSFFFSTRVSLVACGDILKEKKKKERERNDWSTFGSVAFCCALERVNQPLLLLLSQPQISLNFLRTHKQKSGKKHYHGHLYLLQF